MEERVVVTGLDQEDLPFLLELWRDRKVMKYADEFPRFRGWSRRDDRDTAWSRYLEKRDQLGPQYSQLIIWLSSKARIGESFIAPIQRRIGQLRIPSDTTAVIGDIKLLPEHWGRGLGTSAMKQVVRFVFEETNCSAHIVPPHKQNRAAVRVYEKAGFRRVRRKSPWSGHMLMRLTRERFEELYGDEPLGISSGEAKPTGQPGRRHGGRGSTLSG